MEFLKMLWHMPGGVWRGMMAAAPMRQWSQAGGAMAQTVFATGVVLILWLGPWTLEVESKRVDGLVLICLAVLFIELVAIVAINDLSLNLRASKGGLEANVAAEDHPAAPLAVTTTTTTVTPAPAEPVAPSPGDGELPESERVER